MPSVTDIDIEHAMAPFFSSEGIFCDQFRGFQGSIVEALSPSA